MEFRERYDFDRVCRVCLMESGRMVNIFHPEFGDKISQTISTCCGVNISENDNFPKQICTDCMTLANITFTFKQKCQSADLKLREYMEEMNEAAVFRHDGLSMDGLNDIGEYLHAQVESFFDSPRNNLLDSDARQAIDTTPIVNNLECYRCQGLFKCCKDLVDHVMTSHGMQGSSVTCELCTSTFSSKFLCIKHKAVKHEKLFEEGGTVWCPFCDELFTNHKNQLKHIDTHVEMSQHPCDRCECYFTTAECLVNHRKISHVKDEKDDTIDTDIIKNEMCFMDDSYSFLNNPLDLGPDDLIPNIDVNNLNNSFINQHVVNEACITEYDANKVLSEVLECAEPIEPYSNCDKDVANSVFLEDKGTENPEDVFLRPRASKGRKFGQSTPKRIGPNKFSCSQCSRKFVKLVMLKKHEKRHKDKSLCMQCGAEFPSKSRLNLHIKRKHQNTKKDITCTICGKAFEMFSYLKKHMNSHIPTNHKFSCDTCGKVFNSRCNLAVHLRRHNGIRPFVCHICDKEFTTSSDLKTHTRTHTGVRQWECGICAAKFVRADNLKVHMRSHTGERPYSCNICNKSFKQSADLKYHVSKNVCTNAIDAIVARSAAVANQNCNKPQRRKRIKTTIEGKRNTRKQNNKTKDSNCIENTSCTSLLQSNFKECSVNMVKDNALNGGVGNPKANPRSPKRDKKWRNEVQILSNIISGKNILNNTNSKRSMSNRSLLKSNNQQNRQIFLENRKIRQAQMRCVILQLPEQFTTKIIKHS